MSKPNRNASADHIVDGQRTFFVTTNTWERRQLFRTERLARLLIDTIYRYRAESRYRLHEFVVMPDHLHLLITLDETIAIERAVQFIKGGFSFRVRHELRSATEIWQRGFSDRRIRQAEEYAERVIYIRQNPVRAGLCTRPDEYPYSSAMTGFELDEAPAAKAEFLSLS
jgi:putative transposase